MQKHNDKYLLILGANLRKIRESKKISQEELAHRAGIDRSYIGGIERGERNVSILTLIKLSKSLECKIKDITKELPNE